MALTNVEKLRSSNLMIKSSSLFEKELKLRLKWTKKQWEQNGENGKRLNKLCNSMNYWKSKLGPAFEDTNIVFTLYNEEKDVKMDLSQIITSIEELDSTIKVRGFSDFRNPRYLSIYFNNKQEKDIIMEKFRMIDSSYVVYLSWALDLGVNITSLKVHWLPITLKLEIIKKELAKYVNFLEEEKNILKLMSGRDVPSGRVTFKVSLKEGITPETIPHLVNIAKMEALITMPGRLPLCLNCGTLGHISKECNLRFCYTCNELKIKNHLCVSKTDKLSYAATLKRKDNSVEHIEQDDWGAAILTQDVKQSSKEQTVLTKKILDLESQISGLKTEANVQQHGRMDNKRKADKIYGETVPILNEESLSCEKQENENDVFSEKIDFSGECSSESDSEDIPMSIDHVQLPQIAIEKGEEGKMLKRRKKKKTNKMSNLEIDEAKSSNVDLTIKTYGKPNLNNARRLRDEEKYNKSFGIREFIFQD